MAIAFISPREKQKTFFGSILMFLVLAILIIGLTLVLPTILNQFQHVTEEVSYSKPNVTINMDVIDSNSFKNLTPFQEDIMEFAYVVKNKSGKQVTGNISTSSLQEAQKTLETSGFYVITIKEMNSGRSNPFTSY